MKRSLKRCWWLALLACLLGALEVYAETFDRSSPTRKTLLLQLIIGSGFREKSLSFGES